MKLSRFWNSARSGCGHDQYCYRRGRPARFPGQRQDFAGYILPELAV